MPRLVYEIFKGHFGFTELVGEEITIGRGQQNTIFVPGHCVNRCHAVLRQEADGAYRLFDLNSRNGVFIYGQRLDAAGHVLTHGDTFQLADVKCHYRDWDRAPADWIRPVTVTREGRTATLSFRSYNFISGSSAIAEAWEVDVVPLLASLRDCDVTADLRHEPHLVMQLLHKLRKAGELLTAQGCTWRVQLSAEMLELLEALWKLPPDKIKHVIEKAYCVRVDG